MTTTPQAPLAGMRVLDFTRILSGPYATMLLADLGAEVVKIERPGSGDDTRGWGPPFSGGMSTYFAAVNRGKRSVALDLQTQRGQEIAAALAADADVLIENFRPGVAERLGLGYERLRDANPGLVYASINGFGSHGPRAQDAGTEVIVEAQTGLMAMMGTPDGPPVRFGVAMVDIATGMALVSGVLAALLDRERGGEGRLLEFPLYATAFSCLATVIASASIDAPSQEGRWGSGHPSIVPYAAYEASDGFVVLGAINELMWPRLCESLGLAELATDDRARTNDRRVANRAFVDGELAAAVASRTSAEITEALNRAGVLVAPVLNAAAAVEDPQVAALDLVDELDGIRFTRTPLSQFASAPLAPAPALGADTEAVLAELQLTVEP
jgi:crotonobetainyl-CoA:carnitine CoA-transferase CaiB-like acyl-CoA transferase